jgi:hypothetical protein
MDRSTRTEDKITPDDIEAKFREVFEGAQEEVSSTKSQLTTILGILAIVLVLLTYVLGRRGGRKRQTVVEIRRM